MRTIHLIQLEHGIVQRVYLTKNAAKKHLKECKISGTIFSVKAKITKHKKGQ